MGQDISVTYVDSGNESIHVFSLNRSLTGVEIRNYSDPDMIVDPNSASDVLAHRLLGFGIEEVSIYQNMVTIQCEPEIFSKIKGNVEESIEYLYRYYGEKAGWTRDHRNIRSEQ